MARKRKLDAVTVAKSKSEDTEKSPLATFGSSRSWILHAIILAIFVLVFGLISIASFRQKSPTVDEPVHLLSGYASLKWGDFRANPEHPPFAKMLAALPLLLFEIKDPRSATPEWNLIPAEGPTELRTVKVAARMFFVDNDAEKLFFYSKVMMIGLAIVLGIFVYKWSSDLFGPVAAVAALFIYALDPNILAHGQLVHTDLPFAAFFFIGTYFFWRTLDRINVPNLVLTSLFLGLAAITKYAYTVVILAWTILGFVRIFSSQPQDLEIGKTRRVSNRWGKTLVLAAVLTCGLMTAYVSIWAVYGFTYHAIPEGRLHLAMDQDIPKSSHVQAVVSFVKDYHLLPETWLHGQLYVFRRLGRDAYLLGKTSSGQGSWLYFPVAFAVKTPLPTLVLLVGAVVLWQLRKIRPPACLVLPVVAHFCLAVVSGMNIGLRHILPVYPFLFVLLGGAAAVFWQSKARIQQAGVVFLGAWCLLSAVTTFPNYLAFFNELAGGAKNGHKFLLDSNLDWGQDLKGLKRWIDAAGVKKIQFLYFGFHDASAPRYYGIDAIYLPGSWVDDNDVSRGNSPAPNVLAISANHLYEYLLKGEAKEFVKTLRRVEPVATIGYSIVVYSMDAAIEQFRKLIQTVPASAENHYHLANLLNHQGITSEAIEQYRQAVQIYPAYAEAHNSLGLALARGGVLEEAVKHFRKVLELRPLLDRSETQYRLAIILAKQGLFTEAVEYLKEVVKAEPNFPRAYYQLGLIFNAQGEMNKALDYFKRAVSIDPEYAEAHVALGRGLGVQGKTTEAVNHYQEALRLLKARNQVAPSQ